MNWQTLVDPVFSGRLCLTLLHSLWQLALFAVVARSVDWLWGRRSVERSYLLYVAALVAGLAAVPITYMLVEVPAPSASAQINSNGGASSPTLARVGAELDRKAPAGGTVQQSLNRSNWAAVSDTPASHHRGTVSEESSSIWLHVAVWFVALYAAGVLTMLARLAIGIWRAHRFAARSELIHNGPLVELLGSLARNWSMRAVPALARAEQIVVPKVVGLVRPMILLPGSAITGLSTGELEMVLAHELAHIRRYDMWVNLLQRLAEAALFFNPALWYLSHRISGLREFCCDELTCRAMARSGPDPRVRYARALLRVVELSGKPIAGRGGRPAFEVAALAASGRSPSELRRRIAHLFGEPLGEPVRLSRGGVVSIAIVAALVLIGLPALRLGADAEAAHTSDAVADDSKSGEGSPQTPRKGNTDAKAKDQDEYTFPITVFGRAMDQDGKAIAGAEIYLASQSPGYRRVAETKTAADGSYKFENVLLPIQRPDPDIRQDHGSGDFEVFGIAEGYALSWRSKKSFYPDLKHGPVDRSPDPQRDQPPSYGTEDPIELDLTFGPPTTIRGRVVDDSGQPIPKTQIAIRYCDTEWNKPDFNTFSFEGSLNSLNETATVPPRVKTRLTDEDGRFEFTGLPDGYRWRIDVAPPGHPHRWIWAVTAEGIAADATGNRVYSGDFELEFAQPRKVKLRVVYGDTGEPAPKVRVGAGNVSGSVGKTTNDDGRVEVPLPDGRYQVSISPRYGSPYLNTEAEVVVSAESVEQTTTLKLRPAAVVDITVVDAETGGPLSGVDVWLDQEVPGDPEPHRGVHGYYSWEVETRISHYERPRSDQHGRMRVKFEPGKRRIGVGLEAYPKGYVPVEPNGKEIDCQTGAPTAITFEMRKTAAQKQRGAPPKNPAATPKAKPRVSRSVTADEQLADTSQPVDDETRQAVMKELKSKFGTDEAGWSLKALRSFGTGYVVASESFRNGAASVKSRRIVLFLNGKAVGEAGGTSDGLNEDAVQLVNLGTEDAWFVWLERYEAHDPFSRVMEVRLLKEELPFAFRVFHYANDTGYTSDASASGLGGHFFGFTGPETAREPVLRIGAKATASDGQEYPALLRWDGKEGKFRGPARITLEGRPIYEVDAEESPLFIPIDRR